MVKTAPKTLMTGVITKPKGAYMTKGETLNNIVALTGLKRKEASGVMTALFDIGSTEMKKRGQFMLPGFAKFTVKNVPARKAKKGINPFTKEPCVFKAKPASKKVRARPAGALKKQL